MYHGQPFKLAQNTTRMPLYVYQNNANLLQPNACLI